MGSMAPIGEAEIRSALAGAYGLQVSALERLALGYDFNADVYRVRDEAGRSYFLKLRRDALYEPGVRVAEYLCSEGFDEVVAPMHSVAGASWHQFGNTTMLLYPYVEGRSGMDAGLTDAQWTAYGRFMRRLHEMRLSDGLGLSLRSERFEPDPNALASLHRIRDDLANGRVADDAEAHRLADFWCTHETEIAAFADRAVALGQGLARRNFDHVLCHADLHTNNLIVAPSGDLFVIDWDQPVLAPRERDLMFVLGGGIGFGADPEQEALFLDGYGRVDIDDMAMAYYRYEWLVGDVAVFAGMILYDGISRGADGQNLVDLFIMQFAPGRLVEIAHRLDRAVFEEQGA
jgi:spectinomycin phosphotransferase